MTSNISGADVPTTSSLFTSTETNIKTKTSTFNFTFTHHVSDFLSPCWKWIIENLDVCTVLAIVGIVFAASLYLLHIIAFFYARYRLHKSLQPDSNLPGVSIIKPIVDVDKNLYENVESFFNIQYHKFEILFCFNKKDDEAVKLVDELIKKYPMVQTKRFFGGEKVGLNPKINNMMPAYREAKYPLIMISDSGIFTRPDAVLGLATTMMSDEKLALVTQMPYCKNRKGRGSFLEQVYFGTSHARIYLSGNCMGFVCPTGMSSMMRKEALDECGGFAAFGTYLAEDYFFGKALYKKGYTSTISAHPALQNSADLTISSFFERIGRWVKMRMAMLPMIIVVEPLQDCFPSAFIFGFSLNYLFGISLWSTVSVHSVLWFFMDFLLILKVQNQSLSQSPVKFTCFWIFRELTAFIVFIKAVLNPLILWRNNVFRLAWGGRIRSVKRKE